jgi:UrcA family protein
MKANSISSYFGTGMLAVCATFGQAWMVNTARAADATNAQSLSLKVSDLDLSKSSDVATLYARIKSAANQACGADYVTGSRLQSKDMKQCLSQAVDGAVAQINNASLSAYHKHEAGKTGA